jgi:hypothetical protein
LYWLHYKNNRRDRMKSTHNTLWAYSKIAAAALAMVTGTAVLMAACGGVNPPPMKYVQDRLDVQIQVPTGNVVALETTATGLHKYESRANAVTAGTIGWELVTPQAELVDRSRKVLVNYSGPPATWTHSDGSSEVGAQMAMAARPGATNLPYQLSKGTPGAAAGVLQTSPRSSASRPKAGTT